MLGLYRHFKGGYYLLINVLRNEEDSNNPILQYVDVFHPEFGYFARSLSQWSDDVSDREDNITGQKKRFEKVTTVDNNINYYSTERLMEELSKRSDSPLQDIDIEGLNSKIYCRDYCVGEAFREDKEFPKGVFVHNTFNTKEEAVKYLYKYSMNDRFKVYRRVFVEEEVF